MRRLFVNTSLFACAAVMAAAPAVAQDNSTRDILGRVLQAVLAPQEDAEAEAETAEAEAQAAEQAATIAAEPTTTTLEMVLAHERRDADRARDKYRNPAETMEFFQIEPTMTVAEVAPGGGWYTRILAPYLAEQGQYIAMARDSDSVEYPNREAEVRAKAWPDRFAKQFAEDFGGNADDVLAFEIDEFPEERHGTVDRFLFVRAMHGEWNGGRLQYWLRQLRPMLKDDGLVGIVQHRAPADAKYADVNPARGYMRQSDVIKLMEITGFELVASTEINANPKDPANWEGGVWTLPPVLRYGDENRAAYVAIGESDRMTLLFKKAD